MSGARAALEPYVVGPCFDEGRVHDPHVLGEVAQQPQEPEPYERKRAVKCFGWVFVLISSGSPHVLRAHMGVHRTCGEPNEIELTAIGVALNGSGGVPSKNRFGNAGSSHSAAL